MVIGRIVEWDDVLAHKQAWNVLVWFATLVTMAHTTALLPVLLTAAIAVPEMPVKLISLLFCYTLGLMGIISPYATGPGPIYYGSGYVSRKEFWTLGLVFGAIYLAALLVI